MSWGKHLSRPEDLPLHVRLQMWRVSWLLTSQERWHRHLTKRQRRTRAERIAHVRKVGRWGWTPPSVKAAI